MTNLAFFPRRKHPKRRAARPRKARAAGCGRSGLDLASAKYRPKVLLAFSGPVQRGDLAAALASRGFEVQSCATGTAALSYLRANHYDAVVAGIVMPQVDGLELLRELRHRRDAVPVIAVTDRDEHIDHVYQRCAKLAGAVAVHPIGETWGALLESLDGIVHAKAVRSAK
jgi:CheY-like chemotaxis protein